MVSSGKMVQVPESVQTGKLRFREMWSVVRPKKGQKWATSGFQQEAKPSCFKHSKRRNLVASNFCTLVFEGLNTKFGRVVLDEHTNAVYIYKILSFLVFRS